MGAREHFQEYLEAQGRLDHNLMQPFCRAAIAGFPAFIVSEKWKTKRMRIKHPVAWLAGQDRRVQEDMAGKYSRVCGWSPQVCAGMEKILVGALAEANARTRNAAEEERNHDSAKQKMAFPPRANASPPRVEKKTPGGREARRKGGNRL